MRRLGILPYEEHENTVDPTWNSEVIGTTEDGFTVTLQTVQNVVRQIEINDEPVRPPLIELNDEVDGENMFRRMARYFRNGN
jgi:hypothetical protein